MGLGYPHGIPTDHVVVISPEDAATVLWQRQTRRSDGANVRGSLWRVDMTKGTVDPVPMPTLRFDWGGQTPPDKEPQRLSRQERIEDVKPLCRVLATDEIGRATRIECPSVMPR